VGREKTRHISASACTPLPIADNPNLGAPRPDIDAEYVCFPEGEHLIFYMIMNETVAIIGIPHKRMDIAGYVKKQS